MNEPRLPNLPFRRSADSDWPVNPAHGTVRSVVDSVEGELSEFRVLTLPALPAIVSERLVGVGHLVRVFALLDRVALVGRSVEQLARQLLLHRAAVGAVARRRDDPAHAERDGAVWPNVDGNLVRRAADPARLDLDLRLHVAERAIPHLDRIVLRLLGHDVEGAVDDALRDRLLARRHDGVDELRHAAARVDGLIRELRIGKRLALGNFTFTGHLLGSLLLLLGALGAVLGTALAAIGDARRIEGAADDVVANAREILHAAAANHDDRVLLEVVTLAGDVRRHFHLVRQTDAGDLAQRRV